MNMKRVFLFVSAGLMITAALSTIPIFRQTSPLSAGHSGMYLQSAIASEKTGKEVLSGEQIYARNCEICHSMRPPAKTAPPIVGLASRFRKVHGNKEDAVTAMVSFMKKPDAASTALGPRAIKRFGLMPAMSMPDEELAKVSGWLWDQYDPNFDTRGNCR